ncbi:L-rhamnose mutarotase [Lacibacter luteus]|uniref:L-rhamnose mutarotase n=1 Tax=Lacibacter luteus TaxID=2508719 RepID=A0A4V1M729_9BACT|nr:L-rhamnose mutarotase [Lacibacter luteus]RXK58015.1 L-rhamnose mutarotase [Lacibacter luteus]
MKRLHFCLFVFFLLVASLATAADIYVSPNGSDSNDGSKEKPFATLSKALRKAREMRRLNDATIKDGIHIILRGGNYPVLETIVIRPEDSGTRESSTFIETAENEKPVLSGGLQISNWKKVTAPVNGLQTKHQSKIWMADVPNVNGNHFNFRQLWVNDVKAVRAKSSNGDAMLRILNWNKAEAACVIPTLPFANLDKANGLELFIHQWWEIANLRVKKVQVMGDSTKLFFHQPESKIQNEHPWPAPWISKETGNSAFYLTNAIQFLDEPGEWYLDATSQKIYYWPRNNENLTTAKVIAPFTETLISVEGTIDNPVKNLVIDGISFQHTGWLRPSLQGHVPHQAGLYMTEAYKLKPAGTKTKPGLDNQAWVGRQAAAVELSYANRTRIKNCSFIHLAATGIDLKKGVQDNMTKNNLFSDIGGTAILAGNYGDEGREIHLPFDPKDNREKCDVIFIENNFITNATNEDWGAVGIGCGFVSRTSIRHNEIENVSYSGISLGWGWSPEPNMMKDNRIVANKIHHYGKWNYDCSGIYTLSAQTNSIIEENYIDSIYKSPIAHLPSHWFYIYTDEGSSHFTVKNNWTPSQKYLQNNNGPGNVWSNNGPQVHDSVKQNAGIEKRFQYLSANKTAKTGIINEEHNEVIELIVKEGMQLNLPKLKELLAKNNMDSNAIYHWQNHYVIFDKVQDIGVMQGRIANNFPEAEVRVYHDMFYEYSKKKHCADKTVAKEWEHIILTANLVDDKKLQKEYLDYHATQFEKWPEISKGFCNADFQQLLLFRNGRQLMLIISIPKGESLDKLNPRTTANNPRVDEWNKIMKKYQEGIKGTKPGETWVFLDHL